jgi:hypothetical protein
MIYMMVLSDEHSQQIDAKSTETRRVHGTVAD